jgi:putative phosphoesterase
VIRVGVVSDTHGLVRPWLLQALAGSDLIVHAGDVGGETVLHELARLAPVHAVRGNNDHGPWALALPQDLVVEVGGRCLYVLHDAQDLALDPAAAGFACVVTGHSHKPELRWRSGVLHLNPGSPGPRRFRLPIACARLTLDGGRLDAELVRMDEAAD